jgi:hypothetical protein
MNLSFSLLSAPASGPPAPKPASASLKGLAALEESSPSLARLLVAVASKPDDVLDVEFALLPPSSALSAEVLMLSFARPGFDSEFLFEPDTRVCLGGSVEPLGASISSFAMASNVTMC